MSLSEALERAALSLPECADAIRPANGDPLRLLARLDVAVAARVLGWLLGSDARAGGELADAWSHVEGGEQVLVRVPEGGLPKAGRKALRRALHRLRSRGLALAEASVPAPMVARLPPLEDAIARAFISALDPSGAQQAYLVEPDPAGGARLFEVVFDDIRGVLDFEVYSAGRSRVREFLAGVTQRREHPLQPADSDAVRARIAQVVERTAAAEPPPRGFAEWRRRLAPSDPTTLSPGDRAAAELEGDAPNDSLEAAVRMLEAGELGPWPPAAERVTAMALRLEEAGPGQIVVSPAQRGERIQDALAAVAGELFCGDFVAATVARFRESAYVLWKANRESEARACLAVARAFRERDPAENAAARAMLELLYAPLLRKLRNEDEHTSDGNPGFPIEP